MVRLGFRAGHGFRPPGRKEVMVQDSILDAGSVSGSPGDYGWRIFLKLSREATVSFMVVALPTAILSCLP
jgi:hypothetical protein